MIQRAILSALALSTAAIAADSSTVVTLLQQKCATCHGESSGMSGLKVVSREALLKGGNRGPAIIPNKSTESLLYKAASHTGDLSMPPGGTLKPEELQALK